jgi:hypothetical protein
MPAPFSNLGSKVEQAIVALLATKSLGTANIWTAKRSVNKDAETAIIVHAERGVEDSAVPGNYNVNVRVSVRMVFDASSKKASHDTLVAKTFDELSSANLEADVSALLTDFTIMGLNSRMFESGPDEDAWVESMVIELYCAPSDIT